MTIYVYTIFNSFEFCEIYLDMILTRLWYSAFNRMKNKNPLQPSYLNAWQIHISQRSTQSKSKPVYIAVAIRESRRTKWSNITLQMKNIFSANTF